MLDFASVTVVVVGSAMVDQIAYCARVPEDGETLRAHRYVQGFGGKGANQAVMAARLGARVAFVGCVGDDAIGTATIANLAGNGVDTTGIAVVDGAPTGVAPIWVDDRGNNRILIAAGANEALDPARVRAALDALDHHPDVVLAQLETPQPATAAAFAWAAGHGARTVLNPAPAAAIDDAVLAAADWLVPNESEFTALFGTAPDDETVTEVARRGHRIVVTLGGDGAIVGDGAAPAEHVAAPAVDAVDTTGAGDAFVGAFSVGLAAGLPAVDAVRLGCAAGALSAGAAGTQTSFADRDAVLHVLREPTTTSEWR